MFQATRRRLALWYTTVTAVLLLLFATGVYFYVRSTLIDRIDDTLKHVVEVVDRSLVIQPVILAEGKYRVSVEASFRNNAVTEEEDRIDLEWFDPTGKLLWSTFSESLNIPLHHHRQGKTVYLSSDRLLRQVTQKVEFKDNLLGYLRVSHPWFEVTKPIRQLTQDLIIGISIMVASTAAIGWWLSGIAMQPVKDSYSSLKQFTADASHELRNPIATIQTNVQMALAYPDAELPLQQRQLRVIERLTQRLGNLVNDLLFLARSDSGIVETKLESVPLDALLIEVMEEQRAIAEQKSIFLSLRIVEPEVEDCKSEEQNIDAFSAEDIFTMKGDWDQLARLFTNLIGNAIEYTKTNDSEVLDTIDHQQSLINKTEASVEIELKLLKKTNRSSSLRERYSDLQVKVQDNGIGISESALPHIFDRFYRVDPSRSYQDRNPNTAGSGLGLSIVKAIVENHQGQVSVESTFDRGTIFTVTLPKIPH